MSQVTDSPRVSERTRLEKLGVSIRGKLQFMDYLVRAAVADLDRFQDEVDPGTRIFIRQLIEMHAANLSIESDNTRLIADFCHALDSALNGEHVPGDEGDAQ